MLKLPTLFATLTISFTMANADSWNSIATSFSSTTGQLQNPTLSSAIDPQGNIYSAQVTNGQYTSGQLVIVKFQKDEAGINDYWNQIGDPNLNGQITNPISDSLVFNKSNNKLYVAVAYQNGNNCQIRVMYYDEGKANWVDATDSQNNSLNISGQNFRNVALTIDNSGFMYLAYTYADSSIFYKMKHTKLQLMSNNNGTWSSGAVIQDVITDVGISLMAVNNVPYLAYGIYEDSEGAHLHIDKLNGGSVESDFVINPKDPERLPGNGQGTTLHASSNLDNTTQQISLVAGNDGNLYLAATEDDGGFSSYSPKVVVFKFDKDLNQQAAFNFNSQTLSPALQVNTADLNDKNVYLLYSNANGASNVDSHRVQYFGEQMTFLDTNGNWHNLGSQIGDVQGNNFHQIVGFNSNGNPITISAQNKFSGNNQSSPQVRLHQYTR